MKETHRDTALQLAGAVESIGHAIRHAVASVDWPGGCEPTYPSLTVSGMAPEVVDLMVSSTVRDPNDVKPSWHESRISGGARRVGQVIIAGVGVHLCSRAVAGKLSTEFVRSES